MSNKDVSLVLVTLVLFFLFTGEPDVWDKLHEMTMQYLDVNHGK